MSNPKELFNAVQSGDAVAVERILTTAPDLISGKNEGATPLHFAALENHREVVDLLLIQGANLNARDDEFHMTPIGWANERGHTEMVDYLYSRDSEVNLNRAAAYGLTGRVRELLSKDSAQINAMDHYGTPIHEASLWGRPQIVTLLLEHGAEPNLKNCHGQTALEIAQGQVESGGQSTPLVLEARRKEIEAGCREVVEILTGF